MGCYACLVVDDHGQVLFARRADTPLPNASTTKMVTALVTVLSGAMGDTAVVSAGAAATGGGGPHLFPGERVPVDRLLEALLVASSNDAAEVLAEHVAGSEERFVDRMNHVAAGLGATDSNFANPHGLDAPGHHASARDLATFARALLATPSLARIVALRAVQVRTAGGQERFENTNLLLESYPGLLGVKTGYTLGAGNVLVAAAKRGGRRLISVAMRSADAFADTKRLLDYGWRRLRRGVLLRRGTPVASLVFDPGGATTAVSAATVRGLQDARSISVAFLPGRALETPVEAGALVGTVEVRSAGRVIERVPAVADRTVQRPESSFLANALARILSFGAAVVPVNN